MRASVTVIISGRVQGVGYRAWMAREAAMRGIDGWVRNRSDGAVEALLTGERDSVSAMAQSCHKGPLHAKVTDVKMTPAAAAPQPGFRIIS